ncbi:MAG: hypothetical protein H6621_10005 [Halobacteriovoraceae bacterium]|nr:hypothetical protein [Halobacteriovoraceae bacterium]MCB9095390.1 hypothetical protein [Halobacteriovoraceae bacterium]
MTRARSVFLTVLLFFMFLINFSWSQSAPDLLALSFQNADTAILENYLESELDMEISIGELEYNGDYQSVYYSPEEVLEKLQRVLDLIGPAQTIVRFVGHSRSGEHHYAVIEMYTASASYRVFCTYYQVPGVSPRIDLIRLTKDLVTKRLEIHL